MVEEKKELTDQWKSAGLCYKCRRKDYCKTTCRASRETTAVIVKEAIKRTTGMDKAMAVINKLKGE